MPKSRKKVEIFLFKSRKIPGFMVQPNIWTEMYVDLPGADPGFGYGEP